MEYINTNGPKIRYTFSNIGPFWLLLSFYAVVIQFIPSSISVPIGALLSFILYPINKRLAISSAFIAFFSSADLTFGGIISFSGLLCYFLLNRRIFTLNKEAIFCITILFCYLFITIFISFFENIDLLYLYYLKTNVYKGFVIPVVIIVVFSCLKYGGDDYLRCMFGVSILISLGQAICIFTGNDISVFFSYQFSISFILLLMAPSFKLKLLSLFNLAVYILLFIKGQIYFSSQDVMLVLVAVIIYFILYKRKTSFLFLILFLAIIYSNAEVQNVYSFLKDTIGLSGGVAFKFSQIFLVLGSSDFASIPWSPRVRIIELINSTDRNILANIFGSGYVSYIRESIIRFVQNKNEFLQVNDFRLDEISSGMFYGLHNTPRGFLHYGAIYFLLVTIIFYKAHKAIVSMKDSRVLSLINIFLFSLSIWNPLILFVFMQLTFLKNIKSEIIDYKK